MNEISKITGRDYKPFNYYGAPDAERVIVVMGSASGVLRETVDYLNAKGERLVSLMLICTAHSQQSIS